MWHLTTWVEAVKTEEGDSFSDRKVLYIYLYTTNLPTMCQMMHASVNACVCASVFVGVHINVAELDIKCTQLLVQLVISVLSLLAYIKS